MNRLVAALTLLALVGCSQGDTPPTKPDFRVAQAQQKNAMAVFGLVTAGAAAGTAYEARIREQRAFARLPDRGELLSYPSRGSSQGPMVQGAYTWHRVDVSEEHALRGIIDGHLRVLTPSGQALNIRYDRHIEHPSGDLSWIGHIEGQPGAQTVLTFGADAVYGSIGQPGKRSLRLTTRNGAGWIVETDPAKLMGIASAGAHPHKPDALAVPKMRANFADSGLVRTPTPLNAMATATATTTVDVLVGYTQGFASSQGGTSSVTTRLNYLVTAGNEALANSQVSARIRLVHAMQVNYTDASLNETALEQLTGYDASNDDYTTPNAAFNALRAARETYGADLVTLVRDFRDPEQDGCGIAWLIGGGRSGVSPGDGQDYFGYSVVSDGQDENGGSTYFCRDETMIHELAHNLGSQHDRESAEGGDGSLDNDDYGAFTYSFGLKTAATAGNFYTVMAYGDDGQTDYRVFSNPRITFCGGRACGTSTYEDNARSLGAIIPVVAGFRASVGGGGLARNDIDGDGRSDLLWLNSSARQFGYWIMVGAVTTRSWTTSIASGYTIAATGDLNGDGFVDIIWTSSARDLYAWFGNGMTFSSVKLAGYPSGWSLQGTGDINADGRADLLWTNGTARQFAYWIMDGARVLRTSTFNTTAGYRIAATGDFNADGKADLLWTSNARDLYMWLGNGSGFVSRQTTGYPSGWLLQGAADVDADGRSDLLWTNTAARQFAYWIMNGNQVVRTRTSSATYGYRLATFGDLNGDSRVDLLWTSNARDLYLWTGNGSGFSSQRLSDYPSGWVVVNTKTWPM
jgi:hypothetical protein